jgi:hypothetical protein
VDEMNDLQRILVEDHIHGLEHEAAALRAERDRDHRRDGSTHREMSGEMGAIAVGPALDVAAIGGAPVPASALIAGANTAGVDQVDGDSTRVRLGRWLVGVGAAIAGEPEPAAPVVAKHVADGPCDDGPGTLSHAA